MSTEIYGFDREGFAYLEGSVKNSLRGAMSIWRILENRYLPPYRPNYVVHSIPDDEIERYCGFKPSRTSAVFDKDAMDDIWNLVYDKRLSSCEKIVLASTFDYVIIKRENMSILISAFRHFEGETSLKEQADFLENMLKNVDFIAVGFNQTSVACNNWSMLGGFNEETEEDIPYNLFTGDKHWELFQWLSDVQK